MTDSDRFYGKYRGKVEQNMDVQQLGRVQVSCPAVLGDSTLAWALPCAPYAGDQVGFHFVPPVGANVWVEFEGGDPDSPIYSGGFWDIGELPAFPALPTTKLLQTDGIKLLFDDIPGVGGVTLEVGPPVLPVPAKLELLADGLEISYMTGKIKLSATGVSINDGALDVL